jgi:hypothetical protein
MRSWYTRSIALADMPAAPVAAPSTPRQQILARRPLGAD